MISFEELKEIVAKRGYGTALYGTVNGDPVYLSRGIREVFFEGDDIQKIIGAVTRFQNGSYGDAEAHGKTPAPGHEYGHYEISDLESSKDDYGVWIHKDGDSIIVYYAFER